MYGAVRAVVLSEWALRDASALCPPTERVSAFFRGRRCRLAPLALRPAEPRRALCARVVFWGGIPALCNAHRFTSRRSVARASASILARGRVTHTRQRQSCSDPPAAARLLNLTVLLSRHQFRGDDVVFLRHLWAASKRHWCRRHDSRQLKDKWGAWSVGGH